jgi:hypothetical protein
MNLFSTLRHLRVVGELNRVQFADRGPSYLAIILACFWRWLASQWRSI